ncbi:MAG TPA: pirin family protein [Candidatus Binataceae bacterium]|nr:pirin family protein [Candidatus Binataceae bacterium]
MISVRKASDRGLTNIDWLKSRHTFSFGEYYNPKEQGFSDLRVINEDWVAPGAGFPTHSHRDMEIVTYVVDGAVQHKDSMGNGSIIRPGDVQRMSAGTGVTHSEYNPSKAEELHLLQIWILPDRRGHNPGYEQKEIGDAEKRGRLRLIASPDGRDGSVLIHQDARLYAGIVESGKPIAVTLTPGRRGYLHVVKGAVNMNGVALEAGDGARIAEESALEIGGREESEVLLFDLA